MRLDIVSIPIADPRKRLDEKDLPICEQTQSFGQLEFAGAAGDVERGHEGSEVFVSIQDCERSEVEYLRRQVAMRSLISGPTTA
jgi:hypothetical protein